MKITIHFSVGDFMELPTPDAARRTAARLGGSVRREGCEIWFVRDCECEVDLGDFSRVSARGPAHRSAAISRGPRRGGDASLETEAAP